MCGSTRKQLSRTRERNLECVRNQPRRHQRLRKDKFAQITQESRAAFLCKYSSKVQAPALKPIETLQAVGGSAAQRLQQPLELALSRAAQGP
ncbi:hypothetical protein [Qipengyuania profunda]|uniref:hypothetical protein n=1 Tax=Qipengyuania profunda TaxID=3113984 RepID=UPI002ED27ED6